ncbi:ABC transporter permease [Anaerosalibacter bizertensis]|uniref:ABC transporter permease n=1 Tax=Anaerosalibacter bizertensis TaxID=932217 RepID=A0A844FK31_9FIRM|nr:ABC transporter permease [Anaerosalibacter bizertensis]MBV1819971.1 ABC transporter permease [Bacteroidales bacterium MSK.15.36]MBU5292907.1 ABC transporter permease [Anaerosalibacter bizertensis]MCB5558709.1 ABC transporter permease [Anaerosalibacter bizertensis]MCG4564133.1 ABC transporter permease [Anaerosalibacter bizertensis]MCG4582561.1 ABC transporter permease [Anaerosalibacter bizertensis]
MLKYTLKRALMAILTIWVVVTITFFLMNSIPGDPFTDQKKIPPEIMEKLEKKYGLDQPLVVQYGKYLKNILKGDLGDSMKYKNRSVNSIIEEGFPVSFKVGMLAIIFAAVVGITFGTIAGLNRAKFFDFLVIILAVIGVSVPSFVFAALFQYVFGVKLKWFPVARWGTPAHYVMPVLALGIGYVAYIARMMRTSMLDVLNQDYIRTARAKGLSSTQVTWRHTIRNAILPIVTILGVSIAGIVVGSFVIENIFAIPGIGKHFVQSITHQDYTLIMGTTVFYAVILVVMMFLIDIFYGIVDPRIRLE